MKAVRCGAAVSRRWARGLTLCLLAALASACGLFDAPERLPPPAPSSANLISNGGFEILGGPWVGAGIPPPSIETGLPLSFDRPHSGDVSIEFKLVADETVKGTLAMGSAQSLSTDTFPEFISGFYRVDEWVPSSLFQYIEATVTVRGGDLPNALPASELRFLIGAPIEPSLEPGVAYVFLSRSAPELHKWTYFSYPVKRAFEERLGKIPTRWDGIDIGVGVRVDGRTQGESSSSADVFFDDLYAGAQAENPNRPAGQ